MPRKLFDEDGSPIEVPTEDEIKAIETAKADIEAKMKDLEAESNPNWKAARDKMKELESRNEEYASKLKEAGVKLESASLSREDIERIAQDKAQSMFLERSVESALKGTFGEKYESAKRLFDKLTHGETLDEAKVGKTIKHVAGALGFDDPKDAIHRAVASVGSAPIFEPKTESYAETAEGKGLAQAMGISIEEPKK